MNRSSSTPPSSRHSTLYCAPPPSSVDGDLRDVVGQQALQQLERLRPGDFDLAHVRDVEDRRSDSRTARCSAPTPSYCTGISQPANSTIFAPAATWRVEQGGTAQGRGHGPQASGRRSPPAPSASRWAAAPRAVGRSCAPRRRRSRDVVARPSGRPADQATAHDYRLRQGGGTHERADGVRRRAASRSDGQVQCLSLASILGGSGLR